MRALFRGAVSHRVWRATRLSTAGSVRWGSGPPPDSRDSSHLPAATAAPMAAGSAAVGGGGGVAAVA